MTQPPTPDKTAAKGFNTRGFNKRHLFWGIPLGLAVVAVLLVLALPKFVSSGYHRATIEKLASSVTGRNVHIRGKLSLALLPDPQFIAGDITITSPDQEVITAPSLTLDIAPIALLRGQILARSITLQSPHIDLPWPLPGGAAFIAPPRWLTALHAQISNGAVTLGGVLFSHVSADIFTGSDGAFSISGTGNLAGNPLALSLSFGASSAVGSSAVALDIQTQDKSNLRAHISGTYDASGSISGKATFSAASLAVLDPSLGKAVAGSADITTDSQQLDLSNLAITQADASLSGSATLRLSQPLLTLLLTGQNLTLPLNAGLFGANSAFGAMPTHLALDATATRIIAGGTVIAVPHLHSTVEFSANGANITSLTARLAGDGLLSLVGTVDPAGNLQAKAVFVSADIGNTLPALGSGTASLAGNVRGTLDRLAFEDLTGNLGPARFTGSAVLEQRHSLSGALHFEQLDLTPFAEILRNPLQGLFDTNGSADENAITEDFEISADRASFKKIPFEHLLIDARLGDQLVVRRLTATLYGGIAAASFTVSPNPADSGEHNPADSGGNNPADSGGNKSQTGAQTGLVTAARAVLALPSAQPLAALLPSWLQPPSVLTKAPLAFSFSAAGPANALATSAILTLGSVSITAAPSIDLIGRTASGAFTLRHPDAIAAFKAFGLNAGLNWPGAGSIALRANMLLSPTQIGLSDFVLSMGDLTGNGKLTFGPGHALNGQIDADTLALPPPPADLTPLWTGFADAQGKIAISANRVLVAGHQILGPVSASLAFEPYRAELQIAQASIANGVLKASISATAGLPANADAGPPANADAGLPAAPTAPPAKPAIPAISIKFTVLGADSSLLALPIDFPITLPSGQIDLAGDLTAAGYAPRAWLATLAGSASLAAHSGTLTGFDLAGIGAALTAKNHRANLLRSACLSGVTAFTGLNVTGDFSNGVYTIASAALQTVSGSGAATGSIDFPDSGVTLNATLFPGIPAPPPIGLTIAGAWTTAHKTAGLKQALAWKPAAPK